MSGISTIYCFTHNCHRSVYSIENFRKKISFNLTFNIKITWMAQSLRTSGIMCNVPLYPIVKLCLEVWLESKPHRFRRFQIGRTLMGGANIMRDGSCEPHFDFK